MKKHLLLTLLLLTSTRLVATQETFLSLNFYNTPEKEKCTHRIGSRVSTLEVLNKDLFYNMLNSRFKKNRDGDIYSNDELKQNFDITIEQNSREGVSINDLKDEAWASLSGKKSVVNIRPKKKISWDKYSIYEKDLRYPVVFTKSDDNEMELQRIHQEIQSTEKTVQQGIQIAIDRGDKLEDLDHNTTTFHGESRGTFTKRLTGDDTTTSNKAFYVKRGVLGIIIVLGGVGLRQLCYKKKKSKQQSRKKYPKT